MLNLPSYEQYLITEDKLNEGRDVVYLFYQGKVDISFAQEAKNLIYSKKRNLFYDKLATYLGVGGRYMQDSREFVDLRGREWHFEVFVTELTNVKLPKGEKNVGEWLGKQFARDGEESLSPQGAYQGQETYDRMVNYIKGWSFSEENKKPVFIIDDEYIQINYYGLK